MPSRTRARVFRAVRGHPAERTLDRAKAEAGVNSERIGFGDEGARLWSLP